MTMLSIDIPKLPKAIRDSIMELSKDITFEKFPSKGANGYVFLGKNNVSGQPVAIKYYYWGGDKKYHAEPKQLAEINSKYVIKILHAGTIADGYAIFMTPFFSLGDMDDLLSRGLPGDIRAIQLVSNALEGLSHLHVHEYIHRDLKPQNILIGDSGEAVIGDFGSVKKLGPGGSGIPGSGHSLLYTPPESFDGGLYTKSGDIYQVGILLYQLLGGFLPYDGLKWLNKKELAEHDRIEDSVDRSIYVDSVLKSRIKQSAIVNLQTLPSWVCVPLRRIINAACNLDASRRFGSASDFLSKLHSIKSHVLDWQVKDGMPTLHSKTSFRLVPDDESQQYTVEKKVSAGWRHANAFGKKYLKEQVEAIIKSARS
jgi:serine/threonine protein kinase